MKIAVVGSEGTGRTLLATGISEALNLPLLPSLRESLLQKSGYHTLFEWVAAGHHWSELLVEQAAREAKLDVGIVDNGVLDLCCAVQRWGWSELSPDRFEALRKTVIERARSYDHIFVTPSRIVAGHLGARFRSQSHNLQIARLLDALLAEAGLAQRAHNIVDGTIEQRLDQALAALR